MNDEKKRDRNKMQLLLKSLARNESTIVSNQTILNDIETFDENISIESRITLDDYLDVLARLHIIENQSAYSENYRSAKRVGKSPKRHFIDPSLACALLDLTSEKLVNDLKTFRFMFESLVEIKLGFNSVEDAKKNLLNLYDNMEKKTKFMCIIVGYLDFIVKDPETGIYIVPITALKP